jgi:hypothetical protein
MPQQSFSTFAKARSKVKSLERQGDYSGDIGSEDRSYGPGSKSRKVYTVRWQGSVGPNPRRKTKSNPSGGGQIVLLLAAAGAAYWWWTTQSSVALPAGVPAGSTFNPTGGGTAAAPKMYDCYTNSSGMVVAIYGGAQWVMVPAANQTVTLAQYQASLATAPPANTTAPVGNSTPVGGTSAPVTQAPPTPVTIAPAVPTSGTTSLSQIGQNFQAAIAQYQSSDPSISNSGGTYSATPYVWNFYLSLPAVYGTASSLPGLISAMPLASVFPGASLTAPMPLSTYWAGVMSYLGTQGMSGLRGLGYAARSPLTHARGAGWRV